MINATQGTFRAHSEHNRTTLGKHWDDTCISVIYILLCVSSCLELGFVWFTSECRPSAWLSLEWVVAQQWNCVDWQDCSGNLLIVHFNWIRLFVFTLNIIFSAWSFKGIITAKESVQELTNIKYETAMKFQMLHFWWIKEIWVEIWKNAFVCISLD